MDPHVSKHCTNPELVCTVRFFTNLQVFFYVSKQCTNLELVCTVRFLTKLQVFSEILYNVTLLLTFFLLPSYSWGLYTLILCGHWKKCFRTIVIQKQMVRSATAITIRQSFMPGDCGYQYSNRQKKKSYTRTLKQMTVFKRHFHIYYEQ